jgi:hypothetical protein
MMRYTQYILIIFLLAACNNGSGKKDDMPADSLAKASAKDSGKEYVHSFRNKALQARIEDTLIKIPFVKKTNSYIDSFSHHQHAISYILDSSEKGISVMAGYNGPERFETYYNFMIDPSTFEIKVADDLSGEMISIKEYIRRLSNNAE